MQQTSWKTPWPCAPCASAYGYGHGARMSANMAAGCEAALASSTGAVPADCPTCFVDCQPHSTAELGLTSSVVPHLMPSANMSRKLQHCNPGSYLVTVISSNRTEIGIASVRPRRRSIQRFQRVLLGPCPDLLRKTPKASTNTGKGARWFAPYLQSSAAPTVRPVAAAQASSRDLAPLRFGDACIKKLSRFLATRCLCVYYGDLAPSE